ncbi:MAG: Ig-like domain-containing protein [Ignavibacteriae bacterium]|nr:Ig-like domain-containing protein [Ignavibacteriota bacterium]MCB9216562.1 Ig-like domain-containing protein [Ignavibacteria bacterium]
MRTSKLTNIIKHVAPLLLGVLAACASGENIPPPGGPPDKEAPQVRETFPVDGEVNFDGKKVEITFNEYLRESGVSEELVITPIPERPPEIDWSGKTLEIRFRDPLLPNRTYAVTVGGGITDLSGNRLGSPVTLRFSTGSVIDSGRIAGSVAGAEGRKAFVFAWLIPGDVSTFNDTTQFDQVPPDMIAPVADNGSFSLEGLPPGRYRLASVIDEFLDRRYSPGVDEFGVAITDFVIERGSPPVEGVRLRLNPAPLDITPPELYSLYPASQTRTDLNFSEAIDTASLSPDHFQLTVNGGSIPILQAWRQPTNPLRISLQHEALPPDQPAQIQVTGLHDTNGITINDTARSKEFTTTSMRDTLPPQFRSSVVYNGTIRMTDTILLMFDKLVTANQSRPLVRIVDTATGKEVGYTVRPVAPGMFAATAEDTTFNVPSVLLRIDLGGFSDRSGYRADTLWQVPISIKPLPQRGTLQGNLIDSLAPDIPHVIVLTSTEDKREYRISLKRTGKWEIANIPAGYYRLSAFRDTDGNGIYDYGSLSPYRPGEVFTQHSGNVQVRARWTTTDVDVAF